MGHADPQPIATELRDAAEERYLNYALSVITSRALPDVRDGLKPVQRRILYAMYQNLHLTAGARPRKSAAVVGEVLGKYHPHGDLAAYEAMVRMAQPFALRYPLVHGEGVAALVAMIDEPDLGVKGLLKHVKGPDFPTGGEILNGKKELREIYETGQGAVRLRGEYTEERLARGKRQIVVTSLPYTVNKAELVEQIAQEIL